MNTSTKQPFSRTRSWLGLGAFLLGIAGGVHGQGALQQESESPSCTTTDIHQCSPECPRKISPGGARALRLIQPRAIDFASWRKRLADADIDAREEAFDEFVGLARSQRVVRTALEAWSVDPTAPELAWTSRLALRQLGERVHPGAVRWVYLGDLFGPTPSMPLERSVGERSAAEDRSDQARADAEPVAVQLRRIDLPFPEPLAPRRAVSLCAPRRVALPTMHGGQAPGGLLVRTFSLDVQPEGVTLVVREQDARGIRTRPYAAASLDALLDEHPELRDQVPGLLNMVFKPFGPGSSFSWPEGSTMFRVGQAPPDLNPTPTREGCANCALAHGILIDKLGVKCTPLDSRETTRCCLGPGVGLVIESREGGTIAAELGLQRGDILIELCGRPLCSVNEISRVMAERDSPEVEVKIVDRGGRERTLTWRPCLGSHGEAPGGE